MLFSDVKNVVRFVPVKTLDERKFERVQPQLRGAVIALHMDARRLKAIRHVEEESKTALA